MRPDGDGNHRSGSQTGTRAQGRKTDRRAGAGVGVRSAAATGGCVCYEPLAVWRDTPELSDRRASVNPLSGPARSYGAGGAVARQPYQITGQPRLCLATPGANPAVFRNGSSTGFPEVSFPTTG